MLKGAMTAAMALEEAAAAPPLLHRRAGAALTRTGSSPKELAEGQAVAAAESDTVILHCH